MNIVPLFIFNEELIYLHAQAMVTTDDEDIMLNIWMISSHFVSLFLSENPPMNDLILIEKYLLIEKENLSLLVREVQSFNEEACDQLCSYFYQLFSLFHTDHKSLSLNKIKEIIDKELQVQFKE